MRKFIAWAAAVLLVGVAPKAWSQDDAASLQGEYEIVSGENDGKPVPAEHIKGAKVRITADVIATTDAEGKDLYVAKYNLKTDGEPWSIGMTATGGPEGVAVGAKAQGVIQLEGDTLRLCYAPEGNDRPTGFKTSAGSGANLFVLKRIGK